MKGLLMKDFRLVMSGDQPFTIRMLIVAATMLVGIMSDGSMEGTASVNIVVAILAVSIRSYDVYDNGLAFLLTLPVSRKGYVRESYFFEILSAGVIIIAYSVLSGVLTMLINPGSVFLADYLGAMWDSFAFVLVMIAFLTPVYLFFGSEKSAVIMLLTAGVLLGMFLVLETNIIVTVQAGLKVLFVFPAPLFILLGSYFLSVRILERKEF